MGLLYSCFSVINCMFMMDGLKKWYFLSYFIHPILILLCEMYVAGSILLGSLINISIYPYILVRRGICQLVVIMGLDDASIIELYGFVIENEEEVGERWMFDADEEEDPYTSVTVYTPPRVFFPSSMMIGLELPFVREFRLREEEPKESLAEVVFHSFHVQEEDCMYNDPEEEEQEDGSVRSGKEELSGEETEGQEECNNEMEMEEDEEDRFVMRSGKEELRGEEETKGQEECNNEMEMVGDEENRLVRRSGKEELRGEEETKGQEECNYEMEMEEEDEERLVRRSGKEKLGEIELVEVQKESQEEIVIKEELDIHNTHEMKRSLMEEEDEFHKEYATLMSNLDAYLNERPRVMSSILGVGIQELLGDAEIYMSRLDRDLRNNCVDFTKSIEMDFEMVYVGQSCHSWEALKKYHMKFKELAAEGRRGASCYHEAAERFRDFQVRLERFLENEMIGGKRFWNYAQIRSASKNLLLQVPQVPGYHSAGESDSNGSESVTAEQVVQIIENCIQSFSNFLDADDAKSLKMSNMSPVDDINDLYLLHPLIHEARKKEESLEKFLKGKKKHWWSKRRSSLDNFQNREVLFSKIDTKLVSRVLKMSCIPNKHLKWCEEKLNNICISERNIKRVNNTVSFLPPV